MTLNLTYRIKRLFQGESGVVERVEPQDPLDKNKYWKDDDRNSPRRIFVRNPLGELLVGMNNQMTSETRDIFKERGFIDYHVYKQYTTGDKFP